MKKNVTYIGYGPEKREIAFRDENKICTSIRINENGESEFWCNNKCEPYVLIFPPMAEPIKCWWKQSMICNDCLFNLQKKYKIDFKEKIPKLLISKGWPPNKELEYENYTLIKDLQTKIKIEPKVIFDPEIIWWNKYEHLLGIPVYWLQNFILYKSFTKGNKEQGKYNGPDYIFKDKQNKMLIGFEIISYKWNIIDSFKEIEQAKKFARNKVFNSKSFDHQVEELKKYVNKKSNKKYFKCDEMYLGIVVNDTLMDYEYYVLEIILNKYIEENNLNFNGVLIV